MPPKTLVICHKQLGDVLLLEPAVAKIRDAIGGRIEIRTRSGHAPLIELMPDLQIAARTWLRSYDHVFCYDADRKSVVHSALALSRDKQAILRSANDLTGIGRSVFQQVHAPGLGNSYVARYNWDQTAVNSTAPFRPPVLNQPPDEWRPSGFDEAGYLLVNPTAGWKRKRWKTSAWWETLDALPHVSRVVITSGGQDWQIEQAKDIADHLGNRALFLGGQTRLEEFLWLVANARMVLGVDGAASHVAAAFGVPSVTLFLTTSPANWHFPTESSVAITTDLTTDDGRPLLAASPVVEAASALWRSV